MATRDSRSAMATRVPESAMVTRGSRSAMATRVPESAMATQDSRSAMATRVPESAMVTRGSCPAVVTGTPDPPWRLPQCPCPASASWTLGNPLFCKDNDKRESLNTKATQVKQLQIFDELVHLI